MKVISLIGASNTGKSTIFNKLQETFKTADEFFFIEEHARQLAAAGHKLDKDIKNETQCAILEFYLRHLYVSKIDEVGTIITDRNILDTFAYSILNYIGGKFTTQQFLEQKKIFEDGIS